jgi:hypothetical protein
LDEAPEGLLDDFGGNLNASAAMAVTKQFWNRNHKEEPDGGAVGVFRGLRRAETRAFTAWTALPPGGSSSMNEIHRFLCLIWQVRRRVGAR